MFSFTECYTQSCGLAEAESGTTGSLADIILLCHTHSLEIQLHWATCQHGEQLRFYHPHAIKIRLKSRIL